MIVQSRKNLIRYLVAKNAATPRTETKNNKKCGIIHDVSGINNVQGLISICDNNNDMLKVVMIETKDPNDAYDTRRFYSIKRDISALVEVSKIYYDDVDKPDEPCGRWRLTSSDYCKELRPSIIEFFNKKLDDAKLTRLTDIETLTLSSYLNYPSVLMFAIDNTADLSRIAKFYEKEDAETIQKIKDMVNPCRCDRNLKAVLLGSLAQTLAGEMTVWQRAFIAMSQNDRMMGRVPDEIDKEWQSKIETDLLNPAVGRIKKRSEV